MIASEQQSWNSSKCELEALKNTDIYKSDVVLQELVRQKEEVLYQMTPPDSLDYSSKRNKLQWELIRSVNLMINNRKSVLIQQSKVMKENVSKFGKFEKCLNGHYYDSKLEKCPFCENLTIKQDPQKEDTIVSNHFKKCSRGHYYDAKLEVCSYCG